MKRQTPDGPDEPDLEDETTRYGMGSTLMAKMGYTAGSGLGVDGKGIREPVKATKTSGKAGLGAPEPLFSVSRKLQSQPKPKPEISPPPPTPDKHALLAEKRLEAVKELSEVRSTLETLREIRTQLNTSHFDLADLYARYSTLWSHACLDTIAMAVVADYLRGQDSFFSDSVLSYIGETVYMMNDAQMQTVLRACWLPKAKQYIDDNGWSLETSSVFLSLAAHPALDSISDDIAGVAASHILAHLESDIHIVEWLALLGSPGAFLANIREKLSEMILGDFRSIQTLQAARVWHPFVPCHDMVLEGILKIYTFTSLRSDLEPWLYIIDGPLIMDALVKNKGPEWFAQLASGLKHSEGMRVYKEFKLCEPKPGSQYESFLLRALNLIGEFLDLGSHGRELKVKPQQQYRSTLDLPSFRVVLSDWCSTHESQLEAIKGSRAHPSYTISHGSNVLECYIDDDVLYVKFGAEHRPVSLLDLEKYI